ncbi:alpha/beta fold hydrolase [Nocardia cerradoensis]|uniref:alpha/beta fold hydrolase n=1 Tax=Nocardia cerradoensis TaxID=85688 RepID=UPI0002D4D5EC|nr:alpha/beta hydrolase [Nocardia cerradoensis]
MLAHGYLCRIDFWANQIDALANDCRVIAFDHRGHGRSGLPARGGFTAERLSEDLAAVLRAAIRPGERALIAGHSMGGIAIQAWAHRNPGDVGRFADAIALINSSPGDFRTGAAAILAGRVLPERLSAPLDRVVEWAARVFGGIPVHPRLPGRAALMSPFAIGSGARPAARALIQEQLLTTPPASRGQFMYMQLALSDEHFDRSGLTVPTLVIGSTDDQLVGFFASQRLARYLSNNAGLVEIPGGHSGPLEQPDLVTAELRTLIGLGRSANRPTASTS